MKRHFMTSGNYYIGDLFFVLQEEFSLITKPFKNEFILNDDRVIAYYPTVNMSESYQDQFGQEYLIENGNIGCIKIEDIDSVNANFSKGKIISFYDSFNTRETQNRILFGHICVFPY